MKRDATSQHLRYINGPAFVVVDHVVCLLQRLSLVEWLKWLGIKFSRASQAEEKRKLANFVIDVFIFMKWAVLLSAWYFDFSSPVFVAVIAYLLLMNIHTYFWYHLWVVENPKMTVDSHQRDRRRFVNLVLAMAFSICAYAYFYHRILPEQFEWPTFTSRWAAALKYSLGNALTSSTGDLIPKSTGTYLLTASQLAMTFVFAAMLLNNSLPKVHRED